MATEGDIHKLSLSIYLSISYTGLKCNYFQANKVVADSRKVDWQNYLVVNYVESMY